MDLLVKILLWKERGRIGDCLIHLFVCARAQWYRFQRGLKRKPMALIKKLRKAVMIISYYVNLICTLISCCWLENPLFVWFELVIKLFSVGLCSVLGGLFDFVELEFFIFCFMFVWRRNIRKIPYWLVIVSCLKQN